MRLHHDPNNFLTPYRRHEDDCRHKAKGTDYTRCNCPVWADGKLNGKRFRRSTKMRDWTRASKQIDRWLEKPEQAADQLVGGSLQAAIKKYLADCEARNVRASTVRRYRIALTQLWDFAKVRGIADVAALDAQAITDHRQRRSATVVAVTQAKELQVVRTFLSWCQGQKMVTANAAAAVKPPHNDSAPTLPFTAEEIARLLWASRHTHGASEAWAGPRMRARALLLVLIYSGLRISDAVALRRDHVNLATGKVLLYMAKTGVPVYLKLHRDAVEALAALPGTGERFFWDGAGKLSSAAQNGRRAIAMILERAGIKDGHPHRFRDTFAVELLLKGVAIQTVSRLLGHTSVRTTEKHYAPYVAAFQAQLDAAVDTLDFGSAPQGPAPNHPLQNRRRNAQGNVVPFAPSAATA